MTTHTSCAKTPPTPKAQKAKLITQLKALEQKITQFDAKRQAKIGQLAGTLAKKINILHATDKAIKQALTHAFIQLKQDSNTKDAPTKKNSLCSAPGISDSSIN
jgi:hypothetical protein